MSPPYGLLKVEGMATLLRDLGVYDRELQGEMRGALLEGAGIVAADARQYFDEHLGATDYIRPTLGAGASIAYVESNVVSQHLRGDLGRKIMGILAHAREKKAEDVFLLVEAAINRVTARLGF